MGSEMCIRDREVTDLSSKNRSGRPETADALDQLKQETARELGINLNRAPGEKLSAQDAGRVGGQMVRKLIREYEKANRRPDRSED